MENKRPDGALRQEARIRLHAGIENRPFALVENHQIHRHLPNGMAEVVDDNAAELGPLLGVKVGTPAFDDDAAGKFLERFDFWKLLDAQWVCNYF